MPNSQAYNNQPSLLDILNLDTNDDESDNAPSIFSYSHYYEFDDYIKILQQKKGIFNVLCLNCQSLNVKYNELLVYIEH